MGHRRVGHARPQAASIRGAGWSKGAALLRRRPNQSLRRRGRRQLDPSRRGEGAAEGTGDRWYLCRQRRLGVFRWYSRAWWKVSVRINAPAARGGLRTGATAAKCHRGPGRLPSGRGPNADRPFNELATSTARRIAAATWIMSSTTVASRAYAVVPAKRSRWSRGGAYRPKGPRKNNFLEVLIVSL